MQRHYSPKFWHYGYENAEEIHVFTHGCIYNGSNIYGVFFGYADKRNEWGEVQGFVSPNRAAMAGVIRALEITKGDTRVLYLHTSNRLMVDQLERWIPLWKRKGYQHRLPEHAENAELVDALAACLSARQSEAVFEQIPNPDKVPGCTLAISLALDGYTSQLKRRSSTMPAHRAAFMPATTANRRSSSSQCRQSLAA